MIFTTQKIQQGFADKKKTLGVFFDVASAFDKVWHNGLLFKLALLKIPYEIIKAIEDLLRGRQFRVKVDDVMSTLRKIECGVPQGAVLSPTLFSLFINELPMRRNTGIKKESHEFTMLFADDLSYLLTFSNHDEATKLAQKYMQELEEWMSTWRLTLAPHKCAQIVFSRAKKFDVQQLGITLYGIPIPKEANPKFLGVKFDRRLNFGKQVALIKAKAGERISILKILSNDIFWRLDENILLKLYKSLIRSVLEYSSFIVKTISDSFLRKLEAVQYNALRAIYRVSWEEMSKSDLLDKANIESVASRMQNLNEKYFDKAMATGNPFIEGLIEEYLMFRNRFKIPLSRALDDELLRSEIIQHNLDQDNTAEKLPSLLCSIACIKELKSDTLPP